MKVSHWMSILFILVLSMSFIACDDGSAGTPDDGDNDRQTETEQPVADEEESVIPEDKDSPIDGDPDEMEEIEPDADPDEEDPAELEEIEELEIPEIDGKWEGLEWEEAPPCLCFQQNACCDGCWPINEGGPCDDGNSETQDDTCHNGICAGCNPAAVDVTHLASVGGSPTAITLYDNLLLASSWHGTGGFVLNRENPTFPYAIGSFVLDPMPNDVSTFGIEVWDQYAFIMASYGGAYVFDISDPTTPVQVTRIRNVVEGSGTIPYNDVRFQNNIAYFAAGASECIDIWDVTQIDAASHLAQFLPEDGSPSCTVSDLVIDDDTLYAAAGNIGLLILDISQPDQPQQLGAFTLPDPDNELDYIWANGLEVHEDLAYVTFGREGLFILDVSNPSQPVEKSHLDLDCNSNTVRLRGQYAFVACRETFDAGSVKIVNISDPNSPNEIRNLIMNDSPWDMRMDDHYLYVADLEAGVKIYNISDPTLPTLKGMFLYPGFSNAISAVGSDRVYMGGVNDWLWGVNMSWPSHPVSIGVNNMDHDIHDIQAFGNTIFVATSGGLHWLEAHPLVFQEKGYIDTDDNAHRMYFDPPFLYLAIANSGFEIYEFSGDFDALPVKQSGMEAGGRVESVASNGQYLFVCQRSGSMLQAYDISDPTQPVKVDETGAHCDEVWTSPDYAYVYTTSYTGGMQVFEYGGAGNVLDDTPVKEFSSTRIRRFHHSGGRLYGVGGDNLYVFDLSETPGNPELLDTVALGGVDARDFTRFGNTGFVACADVGLVMIQLDVCY